jgi:hypothetical protein
MLTLYSRLIALRRGEPALEVGRFEAARVATDVLAYVRSSRKGESDFLVALNFGPQARRLSGVPEGTIVVSTHLDRSGERVASDVELRPDEGLVIRLADPVSPSRTRSA